MAMELWRPMRAMRQLSDEMDRLFEETWGVPERRGLWTAPADRARMFPLNVYQRNSDMMVEASLPGIRPEDVEVNVVGNTLTIRAERQEKKETKEENYYCREMSTGTFYRQITLPTEVKADLAEASFENGVLTLRLPLVQASKEVPIRIKTGGQQALGQQPQKQKESGR